MTLYDLIYAAGIIPALAGNTAAPSAAKPPSRDHPRSRGEYEHHRFHILCAQGSSPLSRGIHCLFVAHDDSFRIIPALAGNTCNSVGQIYRRTDHPRSRGEYVIPPVFHHVIVRIIPALAGNTTFFLVLIGSIEDHPRSRGEYQAAINKVRGWEGSSPLSRGIPWARADLLLREGIIPALAGNTVPPPSGSGGGRIIPALAGNTSARQGRPRQQQDHPRSRGEYPRHRRRVLWPHGSSPLSRGILPLPLAPIYPERIIPALAGNTDTTSRVS